MGELIKMHAELGDGFGILLVIACLLLLAVALKQINPCRARKFHNLGN